VCKSLNNSARFIFYKTKLKGCFLQCFSVEHVDDNINNGNTPDSTVVAEPIQTLPANMAMQVME